MMDFNTNDIPYPILDRKHVKVQITPDWAHIGGDVWKNSSYRKINKNLYSWYEFGRHTNNWLHGKPNYY